MLRLLLLQMAFDGIGSMPMARIENYRQVKQEAVEFEMKRRNARKNLDHALVVSLQDSQVMQAEGEKPQSGFDVLYCFVYMSNCVQLFSCPYH